MIAKAASKVESGSNFLQIAEFSPGSYANAIIVYLSQFDDNYVVTPQHVATGNPKILLPDQLPKREFTFWQVNKEIDLAVSFQPFPGTGYKGEIAKPRVGEILNICGYHDLKYQTIRARVVRIVDNKTIVVKRINGYKFQQGVSGFTGFNSEGKLVGTFVRGPYSHEKRNEFYMVPATALLRAFPPGYKR